MAKTEAKTNEPKWHESVPEYVDLSDKQPHILRFEDDGDLVKIPGSKSDLNISFLVNEWNGEEWEPNNLTLSSMRALRNIKEFQLDENDSFRSMKSRIFRITREGEGMDTKYSFVELGANLEPLAQE